MDRDKLLDIYTRTMRIARFDEQMRSVIMSGKLATLYYTVRGQELVTAAMMAAVNKDDYLVTTYRGQHDQIAKGVPLNLLIAEIAGRETGTCKGKGGSMHITHPATGVMVTTGVVGSGLGANAPGELVAMSTPTLLANFTTTATGDLSQSATLPSSIGVGDHTLVVASGNTYAVIGLRVVPSSLPTTGLTEGSGRTMVIALFTLVFAAVLVRSRRLTLLAR